MGIWIGALFSFGISMSVGFYGGMLVGIEGVVGVQMWFGIAVGVGVGITVLVRILIRVCVRVLDGFGIWGQVMFCIRMQNAGYIWELCCGGIWIRVLIRFGVCFFLFSGSL